MDFYHILGLGIQYMSTFYILFNFEFYIFVIKFYTPCIKDHAASHLTMCLIHLVKIVLDINDRIRLAKKSQTKF
jgi:hypothetical protein